MLTGISTQPWSSGKFIRNLKDKEREFMSFYRITYNEKYKFATLHNYGCSFRCPVCSYKLHSGADGVPGLHYPVPSRFLSVDEMKNLLGTVPLEKLNFMGGEPSIAKELPEMLYFAKKDLCIRTFLLGLRNCD